MLCGVEVVLISGLIRKFFSAWCSPKSYVSVTFFVLASIVVVGALFWPIEALDTDLWYHLNGGRFFFQNLKIPQEPFYSVLASERTWVDYYWLFQVVVYGSYKVLGYYGIILLRATVLAGLVFCLFAYFKKSKPEGFSFLSVGILCLYLILLLPRFGVVRPHIFGYLFIPLFLYILDFGSRRSWLLLPVLGVLWCNLHGVVYPIMVLILGAAAFEYLFNRSLGRDKESTGSAFWLGCVAMGMGAFLVTPHGWALITLPFKSTDLTAKFIAEFSPVNWDAVWRFQVDAQGLTQASSFCLLILVLAMAAVRGFVERRIRIRDVILLVGGMVLLSKGNRFICEFLLLSLPWFARFTPGWKIEWGPSGKISRGFCAGLFLLLLLGTPAKFFWGQSQKRYPLVPRGLPLGVVHFLKHVDKGGLVWNHPNMGGYLAWELTPDYKIFADMQVPFLFSDHDFYLGSRALNNIEVFRKVMATYEPDFVVAYRKGPFFGQKIAREHSFIPVFFDAETVLFVNASKHPVLARDHGLGPMNPVADLDLLNQVTAFDENSRVEAHSTLDRMLSIYPDNSWAILLKGRLLLNDGRTSQALDYAKEALALDPFLVHPNELVGDALFKLDQPREAIDHYRSAQQHLKGRNQGHFARKIAKSYEAMGEYSRAYESMHECVSVFGSENTAEDLYRLAILALRVGKLEEAISLLHLALLQSPPDASTLLNEIKKALAELDS